MIVTNLFQDFLLCLKNTSFMPKMGFYTSLLFLMGIYSYLLRPFYKKEMVFLLFSNWLPHSFLGKHRWLHSEVLKVSALLLISIWIIVLINRI
jgi:hypothetical protein